jgi:putative FmdB family regulatory protein
MPIYEYHCEHCGHAFELLRRMKDADSKTECPKCGSMEIERRFSAFSAGGCGGPGSRGFT